VLEDGRIEDLQNKVCNTGDPHAVRQQGEAQDEGARRKHGGENQSRARRDLTARDGSEPIEWVLAVFLDVEHVVGRVHGPGEGTEDHKS
jgi:hypothetical protein